MYRSIFILSLIIQGCASVTSPGGGPKDEIAPVLIYSDPPDQSVNFKGNNIILEFSERVNLNNISDQLMITPRLEGDVEATAKKNRVFITLPEGLSDSTTYTLMFRESIRDITENNPAENLKLAFSTGPSLDSAFIEGAVLHLLTRKPSKDLLVGAYFAEDTFDIFNRAPDYLTLTDEEGNFLLSNLKRGKYRLYVLADKNKNSILDIQNEAYGFVGDEIALDSSLTEIEIPFFAKDLRQPTLQTARSSGKYFLVKYNKSIMAYEIISKDSLIHKIDDDNQSIKFYNNLLKDSTQLMLKVTDSLGIQSQQDTVWLKFNESPRRPDTYSIAIKAAPIFKEKNELKGEINMNKPSLLLKKDSLYIQLDSTTQLLISDTLMRWNKYRTQVTFHFDLSDYIDDSTDISDVQLFAADQLFRSVENDSSENKSTRLQWTSTEERGSIEVEVFATDSIGFTVQLLDNQFKVLDQRKNESKFSFVLLSPGTYLLRTLVDADNDGEWFSGDVYNRIEPEPVLLYKKSDGENSLGLKANWILGPHEIYLDKPVNK